MRAHQIQSGMEVLERWRDLLHKEPAGIRQRDAARGAVEQSHAEPRLKPAYSVAQRGRGHTEINGRCAEGAPPGDRNDRFKFLEVGVFHCPDLFSTSCLFIPLIHAMVEH